jgi:prepilin-type N-terminal cleavage/methylation domain-containing protein
MAKPTTRQDGFTLLEVLIALTIFAIGLLGIAGLQVRAIQFNSASSERATVQSVAQMVMENLLVRPIKRIPPGNSTCQFDWRAPDTTIEPAEPARIYTGGIKLDTSGGTAPAGMTDYYRVDGVGDYTATVNRAGNVLTVVATGPSGRTATMTSQKF